MAVRQTRIFVPHVSPFNDIYWVETLVGSIVVPLAAQTEWFWFSRYVSIKTDSGDCNIDMIPDEFGIDQNDNSVDENRLFRSLRFRYHVSDEQVDAFEERLRESIIRQNCVISDFRDYSHLDDLGGDRFIGGEQTQQRRIERADLMVKFLCAICQIFIHCLEGPDNDGKFRIERSGCNQNPQGSIFESAHHLFCNITSVPLRVLISQNGVGTDWSPPVIKDGSDIIILPIRF